MTETKTFAEWISGYIHANIIFKQEMFKLRNWTFQEYNKNPNNYSFALKCLICRNWGHECLCINNIK